MTYLAHEFPDQMQSSGLYRNENSKQIQSYLEWYQNSLRPCVKQMIRFTVTRWKAGLSSLRIDTEESVKSVVSDVASDNESQDVQNQAESDNNAGQTISPQPLSSAEELEGESRQTQMLNVVNEEYLSKFKLICQ